MLPSEKKKDVYRTEDLEVTDADTSDESELGSAEDRIKLERKLLLKLDARMSILVLIYILNYIDRNNAAAARLRGFQTDLHLEGQQFNTLLSILYVGYIIMQIPSNMFLNYIGRPSLYLPCCMVIWGMISILTGIAKGFIGALLTRFFLGFVEAAFFPGALFLISKWYTREELGLRVCILYCGNLISNAFGALMASGILDGMQGKLGRAAWRWLFYIEGSLTIAVALLSIFILPDFPTNSSWLSPEEKKLALFRMKRDVGVGDESETEATQYGNGLLQAIKDWKIWWLAIILTCQVLACSFNAFFPTLTATLGFNPTVTLILVAPPFVLATVVSFLISRHSDGTGERLYHIILPQMLGIVGFILAIGSKNTAARYIAMCLMTFCYPGYIVTLAWISNSVPRPPSKRAVALALTNCISQLGNIAGSYVWQTKFGPSYRNSFAICIAVQGLAIIMCYVLSRHLKSLNKRFEREESTRILREKGFRYLY